MRSLAFAFTIVFVWTGPKIWLPLLRLFWLSLSALEFENRCLRCKRFFLLFLFCVKFVVQLLP